MASSSSASQKAAYLFLVLCCGALLTYGGFKVYNYYGTSKVTVEGIPYGLPAGTSVSRGDFPDMHSEVAGLPVQAQAELRRANELFYSGNLQPAYDIFDALVLLYPNVLAAVWGEVNTLYEMDSLPSNLQDRLDVLVGTLQARYGNTGFSSYLESRKAYRSGNFNASLELARMSTEKAPALYEARLWYADLLFQNSRYDVAEEECRTAISLSMGDVPKAYELLADILHSKGELDSCSAVVNFALTQFPVNPRLMILKGFLAEYKGEYSEAEKLYQRILAFRPDYAPARSAIATVGEKVAPGGMGSGAGSSRDRAELACEILVPLVERYPENLPLREALGIAYTKGRMYDQAERQFKEILKNDTEYPDIQQRLQEVSEARAAYAVERNIGLTANLNRAVDSLRESMQPTSKHDFSTKLGHYLVRYGASPKEFFKKYSISNFRPVRNFVWQEGFYEPPYQHTYTVVFDSLNHFRRVHVAVYDSSSYTNHVGAAPEVFSRLVKLNSRISGVGNSTGETDCGDGLVMDAVVWETRDNFEILARFMGKPAEVRMVRLDKSSAPAGLKLCDYVSYLKEF